MGAQLTSREVLRYPLNFTVREELARMESGVYSDAWEIPEEAFAGSLKDLCAWVESEYKDLDQTREDEVRFSIDIARFN